MNVIRERENSHPVSVISCYCAAGSTAASTLSLHHLSTTKTDVWCDMVLMSLQVFPLTGCSLTVAERCDHSLPVEAQSQTVKPLLLKLWLLIITTTCLLSTRLQLMTPGIRKKEKHCSATQNYFLFSDLSLHFCESLDSFTFMKSSDSYSKETMGHILMAVIS